MECPKCHEQLDPEEADFKKGGQDDDLIQCPLCGAFFEREGHQEKAVLRQTYIVERKGLTILFRSISVILIVACGWLNVLTEQKSDPHSNLLGGLAIACLLLALFFGMLRISKITAEKGDFLTEAEKYVRHEVGTTVIEYDRAAAIGQAVTYFLWGLVLIVIPSLPVFVVALTKADFNFQETILRVWEHLDFRQVLALSAMLGPMYLIGFLFWAWAFHGLHTVWKREPAIVFDKEGIRETTSITSIGCLRWDEIQRIFAAHNRAERFLGIVLKDPRAVASRLGFAKGIRLKLNSFYGMHARINNTAIPVSLHELIGELKEYYREPVQDLGYWSGAKSARKFGKQL